MERGGGIVEAAGRFAIGSRRSLGIWNARRLWMHHLQVEQFLEGVEVAVFVEQGVILLDAERGDEAVDGLSNRSASRAEVAVVAGGGNGKLDPAGLEDLEAPQVTHHTHRLSVCREPLEDFAGHQVEEA